MLNRYKNILLFFFLIGHIGIKAFEIDNMRIIPANPTIDDDIKIVVYISDMEGKCILMASANKIKNNQIEIEAKYFEGVISPSFLCSATDTISIGKLCPGTYTLLYKAYGNYERVVRWNPYTVTYDKVYFDIDTLFFAVINVPGQYPINLPEEISMCERNVTLDAGFYPGIDYLWNTGETTQQINVPEGGQYIVKLFKGNCEEIADTSLVTSDCELYFPNTFTPNNDGINDIFGAKGIDIYNFEIHIYNRWGEKIISSSNINHCWDGKINNSPASQGIYLWQAAYSGNNSPEHIKSRMGHVTLIK